MIYENIISTGDNFLSGCSSDDLGTDTYRKINLIAGGASDLFYYDRSIVTGQSEIQLYVNGQSLLQQVPTTTETANEEVFQITGAGDFFIKTDSAPSTERAKLNFINNVLSPYTSPVNSTSKIRYNVVTGGIFASTGTLGSVLKGDIETQYPAYEFSDYDYFLNGQKVYTGHGVGVSAGEINFGAGGLSEGVVTTENETKFKYTAYRKRVRTASLTGNVPDLVSSTGFIEGRSIFYINGIEQPQSSYLELYSGVNIIKPHFSAIISGEGLDNAKTQTSLIL